MSTAVLERPARTEPVAEPTPTGPTYALPHLTLAGDFNCPWSYLAFRRAAVLAVAGVEVDWHAVEHAPTVPGHAQPVTVRDLQREMDQVVDLLLPGEQLPYDLTGFVPRTRAAVTAYAEAYAAGVAPAARRVIFEAFWMHGIDVGDPHVLRFLLVDELRGGSSPSETVRRWGYAVDDTGGSISMDAWRLTRAWSREWHAVGTGVPVLKPLGEKPLVGRDALDWLGRAITGCGLDLDLPPAFEVPRQPGRELPSHSWVTQNGGHWLPRCQRHAAQESRDR